MTRITPWVAGAAFQVAKEFHLVPDADLARIGTTRPVVAAWKERLRAARDAARGAAPDAAGAAVAGEREEPVAVDAAIEDTQHFYAVADRLVSLMGDREVFLRTGFRADELREAAGQISATGSAAGGTGPLLGNGAPADGSAP